MIDRILAKLTLYDITIEEGDTDYTLIEMLLEEVIMYIAGFCNLEPAEVDDDLQIRLSGYISDRVIGTFLYQKKMMGLLDDYITFPEAPVTSIKEGDTSYNFAVSSADSAQAQFLAEINRMKDRSSEELLPYRRLKW